MSRLIDADALKEKLIKYIGLTNGFERAFAETPTIDSTPQWIPCSERLPQCEQEVLICTKKNVFGNGAYLKAIITPAIYEDGTMRETKSIWCWEDVDYAEYDEDEDCYIIPEGWWENRHFNPDYAYNSPIDKEVVAWMPLPEPYKEASDGTD